MCYSTLYFHTANLISKCGESVLLIIDCNALKTTLEISQLSNYVEIKSGIR